VSQFTQFDRAYVTGESVALSRPEGTPFINYADGKFLIQGPSGTLDVLAVRQFLETADYATGSFVTYAGGLYVNGAPVSAGVWNATEWSSVLADPVSLMTFEVGWDFVVSYVGEQVCLVTFSSLSNRVEYTLTYNASDDVDTVAVLISANDGVDWTTAGTLTLTYDADGNVLSGAWA
jgi:hypothetical protein